MSSAPAPNPDLVNLVSLLGRDNARRLVDTFLTECPGLMRQLANGDRRTRHRIAHSLKSSTRIVGARSLSAQMAAIEQRLTSPAGADLDAAELAEIAAQFDVLSGELRAFAAGP